MSTPYYQDIDDRLASYRAAIKDPATRPDLRKHYAAQEKKLERSYLRDITHTGAPGMVRVRDASEHKPGRWAVYFLTAHRCGRVKIGTTRSLESRLQVLRGCAPEPYQCLGWIPGGHAIETGLHKRLAGSRGHSEWFDITDEVVTELARFGVDLT